MVRRFQTEYICTTHTRFLDPWPHNQTADIGSSCPGNLAMEHQGRKISIQKLIALHFVYPLTQKRNATIAGEGQLASVLMALGEGDVYRATASAGRKTRDI